MWGWGFIIVGFDGFKMFLEWIRIVFEDFFQMGVLLRRRK